MSFFFSRHLVVVVVAAAADVVVVVVDNTVKITMLKYVWQPWNVLFNLKNPSISSTSMVKKAIY